MTHVLVTRPLEASRQLADQLDAAGLTAIVMPLYTFASRPPSAESLTALSRHAQRRIAVFTSPRAVQYGLPRIRYDDLEGLEFAAIGSATRARLEGALASAELGCCCHGT